MQKISADYIFTGNATPIKNGVVILHEDGSIIAIVNPNENPISLDDVQKFNGIICPGFINAHCHLDGGSGAWLATETSPLVDLCRRG